MSLCFRRFATPRNRHNNRTAPGRDLSFLKITTPRRIPRYPKGFFSFQESIYPGGETPRSCFLPDRKGMGGGKGPFGGRETSVCTVIVVFPRSGQLYGEFHSESGLLPSRTVAALVGRYEDALSVVWCLRPGTQRSRYPQVVRNTCPEVL